MRQLILKNNPLSFKLNFDEENFFKQVKKNFTQEHKKDTIKNTIEVNILAKDKKRDDLNFFKVYQSKDFFWVLNSQYLLYYDKPKKHALIYCQKNIHILKNALRLLTIVCADKDIIFLHAASARCGEDAVVFCGPSGSGKTTLTKLLPKKFDILSDDLSLIRRKNGSYYALKDTLERNRSILDEAKIKEVFFLKKSNKNKKIRISKGKALALILTRCPLTEQDKGEYNILKRFNDLVRIVPTYILEFRNDQSITDFFKASYKK